MMPRFCIAILALVATVLPARAGQSNQTLRDAVTRVGLPVLRADGSVGPSASLFDSTPEAEYQKSKKSPSKAVVFSLVLPGLGHQYAGETGTARAFLIAEAAIWTSFLVFQVQGHLREEEYEQYALTFSGITTTGHSDDYFQLLGEFNSSAEYEEFLRSEGRAQLYPFADLGALNDYVASQRVSDFEPWVWPSELVRRQYRERRSASKEAYRRSLYAAAVALANRVVSAFLSVGAVRGYNEALDASAQSFHIELGDPSLRDDGQLRTGVSFVRRF